MGASSREKASCGKLETWGDCSGLLRRHLAPSSGLQDRLEFAILTSQTYIRVELRLHQVARHTTGICVESLFLANSRAAAISQGSTAQLLLQLAVPRTPTNQRPG